MSQMLPEDPSLRALSLFGFHRIPKYQWRQRFHAPNVNENNAVQVPGMKNAAQWLHIYGTRDSRQNVIEVYKFQKQSKQIKENGPQGQLNQQALTYTRSNTSICDYSCEEDLLLLSTASLSFLPRA